MRCLERVALILVTPRPRRAPPRPQPRHANPMPRPGRAPPRACPLPPRRARPRVHQPPPRARPPAAQERGALFAWLISHQPAVLFSHNEPATSNQPAVLFSQNKPAPAISHQPTEQAKDPDQSLLSARTHGAPLPQWLSSWMFSLHLSYGGA
jgi:hypothetical protein